MRGFDHELGFFDALVGQLGAVGLGGLLVGAEDILPELAAGVLVPEELGVVEQRAELLDDLVGVLGHVVDLALHQGAGRVEHGRVGGVAGGLEVALVQQQLRLEDLAFGGGQVEVDAGHHLARALAHPHVGDVVGARVAPIAVKGRIDLVRRYLGQVIQQVFDRRLADALDESLEGLAALALGDVVGGQPQHRIGDALGGDSANGQAVRTAVLGPLPAQDQLEVRRQAVAHAPAHTIEAQVGHVVLATGIKAAADLDVQVLHGSVKRVADLTQAGDQLGGQAARGRDAQLAGVGAGAGGDVDDGAGAGRAQARPCQRGIQRGQVSLADPAQHDVLLNGGAQGLVGEAAGDVGQGAQLGGGDVAQGQVYGDRGVAGLLLRVHVAGLPRVEARGPGGAVERRGGVPGRLVGGVELAQVSGPGRVVGQNGALFQDQALELFDAKLGHQELEPGAVAVLLFAQAGKHAGDGLRQGQDLVFSDEGVEQLGVVGHGAQPAADVELEAALFLAVHPAGGGDVAQVVHVHQPAG